ncbi:MAG: hypothetical protein EBX17_11690, partial [Betaproteobacteria bacterium]|nr:hypothetical protein [Betaproteobacteria bacterium]
IYLDPWEQDDKSNGIGGFNVVKHDTTSASACCDQRMSRNTTAALVRQIRAVCADRAYSAVLTCAPGRSALVAAI